MFKRSEVNMDDYSMPAKRPKYELKKGLLTHGSVQRQELSNNKAIKADDVWGDDFAEEDIEEMDFVASQACLQDEVFSQSNVKTDMPFVQNHQNIPSTSKDSSALNVNEKKTSSLLMHTRLPNVPKRKAENGTQQNNITSQMSYVDFEMKLMNKKTHNSTFQVEENVILSEGAYLKELERLRNENKKLLNDFITKDGETVFLRNQLQQTQLRAENDRLEKTRFIEEQANQYRTEINAICKEREYLKTQLDLQTFEVGNLMERCKLLENGSIKLTEPQAANLNYSMNRSKHNLVNRLSSSAKSLKVKETSVQTNLYNRSSCHLKTCSLYHPLAKIPKMIYDTSQPEKSVVDVQVIEKTGRRNLPILQEEETFRIFENPDLVKPVITLIDDRRLTAEFILPEVAVIQRKTDSELESENSIPIINKLVSTARELILNAIIVLQTIFQAMRNDDIRDMNDIYFSELYLNPNITVKSICDANAWHEGERGIEARRVLGVLSYVTVESTYLSQYIVGKTHLITQNDESYKNYSRQMTRYQMWPEKGTKFEMLEMILKFVTLVGFVRRSHQFSGLISAIAMILYNAQKRVDYCCKGMDYVFQIFKEIVFSRPMPYCYVPLCDMMTVFVKSASHLQKLCANSQSMAVNNWKGALHFTPNACPLQIFLAQMENYRSDLIATIDITHSLLLFVQHVLQTNVIPLRTESSDSCNCCMKLVRYTIKTLCKCSEVNLTAIENQKIVWPLASQDSCGLKICLKHSSSQSELNDKCVLETYKDKFLDKNYWSNTRGKQSKVLRDGIRFLCHLAICDPDFVIRLSDIEDAFYLFVRNIGTFDFVLHQNEREAMNRIKQTFIFEKVGQIELQQQNNVKQLDLLKNFEKRFVLPTSSTAKKKENHGKNLAAIKTLYNSKIEYSDY